MAYYGGILGNPQGYGLSSTANPLPYGSPQPMQSAGRAPSSGAVMNQANPALEKQIMGQAPTAYGELPEWAQSYYGSRMQGFDAGVNPYQQKGYLGDYNQYRDLYKNTDAVDATTGAFTPFAFTEAGGSMDPSSYDPFSMANLLRQGADNKRLMNPITGATMGYEWQGNMMTNFNGGPNNGYSRYAPQKVAADGTIGRYSDANQLSGAGSIQNEQNLLDAQLAAGRQPPGTNPYSINNRVNNPFMGGYQSPYRIY